MNYRRAANLDKNIIFQEHFNDEQSVRRNGGVLTNVTFDKGVVQMTGGAEYIEYPALYNNVVSVRIRFRTINVISANDKMCDFRNPSYGAGFVIFDDAVTVRSSSGTEYVDGVVTDVVSTDIKEIVVTGMTISGNQFIFGNDRSKGAFALNADIELFEIYSGTLTAEEVSNLYLDARYVMPQLDTVDHQRILHVTARNGVVQEISDQNTITDTDVSVFKDGSIRVMDFNGSSSLIESTLSNDVNTIIFWAKPKTADESIIDIGGGNTISIASGVLTAAWADDLYVDGASGTAVQHPEWNLIVCRANTALALADIDIGKISAAFYDGLLSEVVFIDGVVTDAEISQVFSSSKYLYQK